MAIFDKKGMLIIPNPMKSEVSTNQKTVIISELYCPQGHSLLNPRTNFNSYPGIYFKVTSPTQQGFVALSPIFGQVARIAIDIDLISGAIMELRCPHCDILLPIHSPCNCGGNLIALFLTRSNDFNDCVGICNRVDCRNFRIIESGEMITAAMLSRL